MRKIVWTFGIIAGVICGGIFYLDIPKEGEPMNFDAGQAWGYLTMIIALSTIFFAVWQYRKTIGNGRIGFKKSFLIGLYITLIASVIYIIGWEVFFNLFASDFGDQYINWQREKMMNEGMSLAEVNGILEPQKENMDLYSNNAPFRYAMTFLEIFPVGLIISLLVATIFGVFMNKKAQVHVS